MKFKSVFLATILLVPFFSAFSMQPKRNTSRSSDLATRQSTHLYNVQRYQALVDSITDRLENMVEGAPQYEHFLVQQGWLLIMLDIEKKLLKILKLENELPLRDAKLKKTRRALQALQDELFKYEIEHNIDEELKGSWLGNL